MMPSPKMSVARLSRPTLSSSGGMYCTVPRVWVRTRLCWSLGSSLLQAGGGTAVRENSSSGRARLREGGGGISGMEGMVASWDASSPSCCPASRAAQAARRPAAPEPKVGKLGGEAPLPRRLEQHIARLQVAVHHACRAAMRHRQAPRGKYGQLSRQGQLGPCLCSAQPPQRTMMLLATPSFLSFCLSAGHPAYPTHVGSTGPQPHPPGCPAAAPTQKLQAGYEAQ